MPEEYMRRLPYVPKSVAALKISQGRIAVLGTLVSKDEDNYTFAIDDGTSQVVVILNDLERFKELAKGVLVRVLGRVVGAGEEAEILADTIQDFSKINIELYNKHIVNS
jgi:hypothetical protein